MISYNPSSWYWAIPEVAGEVFSSAKPGMVPATDKGYTAFLAGGNTPSRLNPTLSKEAAFAELYEVLRDQAPSVAAAVEAGWRKDGYLENVRSPTGTSLELDASQAEIIAKCVGARAEEVRAWSIEETLAALAAALHSLAPP